MGSKSGLEYDVRGGDIDADGRWHLAHSKIKQVCADMNRSGGWELASMSWPQLWHAVLVFTRPMKKR